MPVIYDENIWRALYKLSQGKIDGVPQPVLTYGNRLLGSQMFQDRIANMTGGGFITSGSILVVGSAYGYDIAALNAAGLSDVWGIDPSPWIWDPANDAEWAPGIKALTANDWIGSGTEVASLTALPGVTGQARFTFIVDADAASSHSDAELPVFIAGCEARLQGNARGRIVHIVTPLPESGPGDSAINWKTMPEWKAVAPSHTWVDAVTGAEQT